MILNAKLKLTTEELTALRQAAGKRGESVPQLLDRCFQDAIEKEIREVLGNDAKIRGPESGDQGLHHPLP